MAKSSEVFKKSIQYYLEGVGKNNPDFQKKLDNPKKSIDDCITYILNQVKSSGINGFENSEIYGMAMHYYDEKDIKPGAKINAQVVVNHQVKLTDKEIKELKEKARKKVMDDEIDRMRKKKDKRSEYKKPETPEPGTLF